MPSFALKIFAVAIALFLAGRATAAEETDAQEDITRLKAEIVALARSFAGQGDPDFSRQRQLEPLVEALLERAPQPPVRERLELLQGPWKQIWGPYDYRNDDRGVDPQLSVDDITQVVFPGGYYYNVAPILTRDGSERIALLRGEYKLVEDSDAPGADTLLKVRFTRYPGVDQRPAEGPLWPLAAQAEAGTLENEVAIVPRLIVWLFFGGGYLREVYTDETLRITYGGQSADDRSDEFIYVMERVGDL